MASRTDGQLVTFYCDFRNCDEKHAAAGIWIDVWEDAKNEGWKATKNNQTGEWEHRCPKHSGWRLGG